MTTKPEISKWFDKGVEDGWEYMIVAYDTFDYSDYPIYTTYGQVRYKVDEYKNKPMSRVMEVYDLSMDKELQLKERRAFHLPEAVNYGKR